MDSETITSTAGLIGAVGTFLALIGAGIWKLISRADRKRETREAQLIATLKAQLEEKDRDLENARNLIRWHERVEDLLTGVVHTYREQLIRNHIEPDPADLPAYPPREIEQ